MHLNNKCHRCVRKTQRSCVELWLRTWTKAARRPGTHTVEAHRAARGVREGSSPGLPTNSILAVHHYPAMWARTLTRLIVQLRTIPFVASCHRNRAQGNGAPCLVAPADHRSHFYFSEPLGLAPSWLRRTGSPIPPARRSPSRSPGCVSRRGFTFGGFIEEPAALLYFSRSFKRSSAS
jgi:hypothetical protein